MPGMGVGGGVGGGAVRSTKRKLSRGTRRTGKEERRAIREMWNQRNRKGGEIKVQLEELGGDDRDGKKRGIPRANAERRNRREKRMRPRILK